jgi:hypothetical protein
VGNLSRGTLDVGADPGRARTTPVPAESTTTTSILTCSGNEKTPKSVYRPRGTEGASAVPSAVS